MGALVEAQLEAMNPSTKASFRQSWIVDLNATSHMYCDAIVCEAVLPPKLHGPVHENITLPSSVDAIPVAQGILFSLLSVRPSQVFTVVHLGSAVAEAVAQLKSR